MADFSNWLQSNWVSFVGAVCGITGAICGVGSFWLAAACFSDDRKAKLVADIRAIEERYDSLWNVESLRPELKRVFEDRIDLLTQPMSKQEEVFLRRIIMQFEGGWRLETALKRGELDNLAKDARDVFGHPLPRAMWEKLKGFRNKRFAKFMKKALKPA